MALDVITWSANNVPDSYKNPADREYIEPDILMRMGMYYLEGDNPGTILEYCFQGDWKQAIFGVVTGGGDITLERLFGIGLYLTNRLPMLCSGTPRRFNIWSHARGLNNIVTITNTHLVLLEGESIAYAD